MRIGIGLPSGIAGATSSMILEWAHKADGGPFSSLAVIDRYVYDSYEPLTVLAAAAAVTKRVRQATTIVIAPLRNTAAFAKTAATVDALSGGRLVLGLSVGAREDDYRIAGIDYRSRGRLFDRQLSSIRELWGSGTIGPSMARPDGPQILVGGLSDDAYVRTARYADGYIHGGGPPHAFARAADRARAAWRDMGRPGLPQLWGQGYFALGNETVERGADYLKHYYAFTGPFAEKIAGGLLSAAQSITQYIKGYEEAGCDELVLMPTVAKAHQLDRLADVCAVL
jgi:alkanesulfonate monooxygenase SsuD/methylene tetrahydromethanopterin reductase-like flavin-dependent oxidoreductase (luciferase family)